MRARRVGPGSAGAPPIGLSRSHAPIRVLQLADVVNRYDFIDNVVRNLDRERFWVGVCTLGRVPNICDPAYREAGIPWWDLPALSRRSYPSAAARLARLLARERIDVLHVHHYEPALVAWLATRLQPSTRLVIGRHYSDAIYLNSRGWRRRSLLAAEALINASASRIIVPSTMIRSLLVDRQRVPARKVAVVPYGFDPARYELPGEAVVAALRRSLDLDGCFVIGTFARLYVDKGHVHLLDALAQLRERQLALRWLVVGDGPERGRIERRIADRGLEDVVRLLSWRSDVLTLMRVVDVVVQPSIQEAFSQAMAEALWMGRPLVMTDVSAARDVIVDGRTALLVPPGDPPALAKAIARLAGDPDGRETLGRAARDFATGHLAIGDVIRRQEALYVDVCRPTPGAPDPAGCGGAKPRRGPIQGRWPHR